MDLQQFYKETEKIVLFPGSLDDLNKIESLSKWGKQYEFMPISGSKKYLSGILIPSLAELRESLDCQVSEVTALRESGLASALNLDSELLKTIENQSGDNIKSAENLFTKMFSNRNVSNYDIRVKAKAIGANGLVHIQLYQPKVYMGIPIRHIK